MTLTLYNNASDPRVIHKTKTTLATLSTVKLLQPTDIINPSFILENTSNSRSTNYVYATEFSRYYFVDKITILDNHRIQIDCKVDVLESYATEILTQTEIVHRQQNKYNLYLDDGIFKTYQNPKIITKAFPTGFTTQNFVLAVAGG